MSSLYDLFSIEVQTETFYSSLDGQVHPRPLKGRFLYLLRSFHKCIQTTVPDTKSGPIWWTPEVEMTPLLERT